MSTDRELLALAAKAAGLAIKDSMRWPDTIVRPVTMDDGSPNFVRWNPLADDGDALRLAVSLDLTVRHYSGSTVAQSGAPGTPCAYEEVSDHKDPHAAARRAIVRAAARIGRAT